MLTISIIVPIYGVEKYIEHCVRSLFEQTYENIEYIFVNDCTKDKSIDILCALIEKYPCRKSYVKIINHKTNRGLAAARNTGVEVCTGDYLMHVDSDDWLEADAVEKLAIKAENEKVDIILFGYKCVYADRVVVSPVTYWKKDEYVKSVLLHTTPASIWNKFYSADFYKKSGIYSIEGIDHGEDYVVVPRLVHKAKSFSFLNSPLYNYNLTNVSSYTKNVTEKSVRSVRRAYEIVYSYFKSVEDKDVYESTIKLLPYRSMLALLKKANKKEYTLIVSLYPECFQNKPASLSKIDYFLYFLLCKRCYSLIYLVLFVYKKYLK